LLLTGLRRRSYIREAERNGYRLGEYVQGGGHALSATLLRALSFHHLLDDPFLFFHSRIADDTAVTIMCYRVGLVAVDYNGPGEVFAVINNGIPESPEQLCKTGYAVVHSVKLDERWSEAEIRRTFADLRSDAGDVGIKQIPMGG